MSDDEFDETALRAAALKSMATKRGTTPEPQRFTPLPRPDLIPAIQQQLQRPIGQMIPNFEQQHPFAMNYSNHLQQNSNNHFNYNNSFNFRPTNYHGNYSGNYQQAPFMQMINHQMIHPHQIHQQQMQAFNYSGRPQFGAGFPQQQPMYQNAPFTQTYNNRNQSNHAPPPQPRFNNHMPSNSQSSNSVSNKFKPLTSDTVDSSQTESRRLPERFSRIERSDSESDEDDRLDDYADPENDKSRDSLNTSTEFCDITVTNDVPTTENVQNDTEISLILTENVDYDELLGETKASNEGEASDNEADKFSRSDSRSSDRNSRGSRSSSPELEDENSSQPDNDRQGSVAERESEPSPTRTPSRRVVVVARDTPEKKTISPVKSVPQSSRQTQVRTSSPTRIRSPVITKSPVRKEETVKRMSPPVSNVSKAPVVVPRKIRLKVDGDMDAIERRRIKFGSVDDVKPESLETKSEPQPRRVQLVNGNYVTTGGGGEEEEGTNNQKRRRVRIPSYEEEEEVESNRKKIRSFVVLKK